MNKDIKKILGFLLISSYNKVRILKCPKWGIWGTMQERIEVGVHLLGFAYP